MIGRALRGATLTLAWVAAPACSGSRAVEKPPSIPARPAVIDVADFGAVGDGIADDGPAIEAALRAAGDRGGTVRFAPRIYRIAHPERKIRVPSHARVVLNGATLRASNVDGQPCWALYIHDVTDIEISGGTIEGSRGGTPASGFGIYVQDASRVRLVDLELRNFWWDGLVILGRSTDISLTRVHAHHNRRSNVSVVGGNRIVFRDSAFDHAGDSTNPQDPQAGVNVETEALDGVAGAAGSLVFDNCEFAANGIGAAGRGGIGLYVHRGHGGTRPTGVHVRSSRFIDNRVAGFVANEVDDVHLTNSHALGHDGPIVGGAAMEGFGITDAVGVHVVDCEAERNSRAIYVGWSSLVFVYGNTVKGTAPSVMAPDYDGITIAHTTGRVSRDVRIALNHVSGFGGDGIHVSRAANASIVDNDVVDNGRNGVALFASPGAIVDGNRISGNSREADGFADVLVGEGSHGAAVSRNTMMWHAHYSSGVARGGDRDHVTLAASTAIPFAPDWLVGVPIELIAGSGAGQRRIIRGYDPATGVIDVDSFVPPFPDKTTSYELRWGHRVGASIRVLSGATGVTLLDNDIKKSAAISDHGAGTFIRSTLPNAKP